MSNLEEEVEGLQFLEKLVYVFENGELDFWEDRKNPPNLSIDEFKQVMNRITAALNLKWVERESKSGLHCLTGEDHCFKFNCEADFGVVFEIESKRFFVKGYFFDKGNLKGVTIQSFRED
jgi:hypothetical protein